MKAKERAKNKGQVKLKYGRVTKGMYTLKMRKPKKATAH